MQCRCITCELEKLTLRLHSYRVNRRKIEMGRLDEKWLKAGGVVSRSEKRIEDRLDSLIARETEIDQKADSVFDKHNAPLDDADRALDALEAKLNLLSNGGPNGPLPGSSDTQEQPKDTAAPEVAPPPVTFQPQ